MSKVPSSTTKSRTTGVTINIRDRTKSGRPGETGIRGRTPTPSVVGHRSRDGNLLGPL